MKRAVAIIAAAVWLVPSPASAHGDEFYTFVWNTEMLFQTFPVETYASTALGSTWTTAQRNHLSNNPPWNAVDTWEDFSFTYRGTSSTLNTFSCQGNPAYTSVHAWINIIDDPGANYLATTRNCQYIDPEGKWQMRASVTDWDTTDRDDGTFYFGTGTPAWYQADFRSAMAHELGHATGFWGHFGEGDVCNGDDPSNQTMCAILWRGTVYSRTLGTHDIHAFQTAMMIL